jgi:hypothetical protein
MGGTRGGACQQGCGPFRSGLLLGLDGVQVRIDRSIVDFVGRSLMRLLGVAFSRQLARCRGKPPSRRPCRHLVL